MSTWTPPELRSQEELAAMLAHVTEHGYGSMSKTYVNGILAALNWTLGRASSPITQTPGAGPVTRAAVSTEHGRAYEALYPTSDPVLWAVTRERGQDYTLAVEHTLAWATGSDVGLLVPGDWPWPQ